jgi:hypothetical protein
MSLVPLELVSEKSLDSARKVFAHSYCGICASARKHIASRRKDVVKNFLPMMK